MASGIRGPRASAWWVTGGGRDGPFPARASGSASRLLSRRTAPRRVWWTPCACSPGRTLLAPRRGGRSWCWPRAARTTQSARRPAPPQAGTAFWPWGPPAASQRQRALGPRPPRSRGATLPRFAAVIADAWAHTPAQGRARPTPRGRFALRGPGRVGGFRTTQPPGGSPHVSGRPCAAGHDTPEWQGVPAALGSGTCADKCPATSWCCGRGAAGL